MQSWARNVWFVRVLIVSMALLTPLPQGWAQKRRARPAARPNAIPARQKVAEGRYELKRLDAKASQNFEEPWTLYKTNVGYELEEQWIVTKDPQSEPVVVDIGIEFAPGLYPIQLRVGGMGSSKQLVCRIEAKEFGCESGGVRSKIPMQGSYNLFLPSPWMLSSIARRAKKLPQQATKLQLVRMEGVSAGLPQITSFEADVQYVGDDQVEVEGTKMEASIIELKSKSIPSMLMWLSPDGIVLALQDSAKSDQRMELVKFTRFAKF